MTLAAPNVHDGGDFSADSVPNSDDEQLDDTPFLSHQLPEDHESFSEKFLRNILTHDYQNLMPRRREKFVEITKTVTVTEIVNGAPDKHPSSCEVKVTNVSPAGPHPVNVSIKHLHEKWHSCEELNGRGDLGKGTVIHIHETHKPFNYQKKPDRFVYEDVVNSKVDSETKIRPSPPRDQPLFNRSSDNVIDLEFRHPILVETQTSSNGSSRRRFADLRKRVSTTTKTSMTETEKVTTTRRSSSAHSTSSRRSYEKPEVHTLYYRKFVEEDHKDHKDHQDDSSDSGSVIIHRDAVTRRSRSADPLRTSPVTSPVAPPRKRLGREESLHYYRDDEEVMEQNQQNQQRRVTVKSPDDEYRKGNTSVSMNDTFERQNLTAGITSISMNNSCTDTSFESRFSTIPRARSSPPGSQRINHIHVNVIGPSRTPEAERKHPVVGRVGEDVTMDIFIERRHQRSASGSRRGSAAAEAPPKPPRRSKYEEHHHIGEPLATSTPMTTIERKQTREERISTESGQSSRKSTRSARPPDINIIECETILRETRSPARTPATPIVVINQTPSSRRSSQDLLGDPGQRRRKSTVTDIDWYAAFNMKDPSSPTKPVRPPFAQDERKSSRDIRRRASDSSMIGIPPADIDLNQIFTCTNLQIKKDEKCQCNACRLIRMSEAERASRMVRESRTRQSRSYQRVSDYEARSSTLPSRHRTSPVEIRLEDVFNPKPTSKPPTPPNRRRLPTAPTPSSSVTDEPGHPTRTIDRSQVTTNSEGPQLHAQLLSESVGHMIHDAQEWEVSRKSSTASSTARKASVARRISVDELTKPEKRKSKHSVSLPPSDVSIDDIFTALTHRKEDPSALTPAPAEPEKKTFIVTRKQRAQDIDPIDFEKDRPVAPPRTKKDPSILSEATVILELSKPDPVISTASLTMAPEPSSQDPVPIDLENVFSGKDTLKRRAENTDEDEKIKKRVAEFEKSQQEKLANRMEEKVEKTAKTRRTSWENSDISMDDVFEKKRVEVVVPMEEQKVESTASIQLDPAEHTSEATISLDDVFAQGEASVKSEDSDKDEKIRRRIAEFQRAEQEKKSQKTGVESRDVATRNLETSEISMEAVFNASAHSEEVVETKICEKPVQKSEDSEAPGAPEAPKDVVSSTSINLKDPPAVTSSENINLDDVFTQGNHPVDSSKQDEEDRKIKRRIAEFQRSQQEKERQTEVEDHSRTVERTVVESDISMDDVFNTSKPEEASEVSEKILEVQDVKKDPIDLLASVPDSKVQQGQEVQIQQTVQERLDQIDESANKNRTSAVSIDLDDVFTTGTAPTSKADDEEDKKIRRRVAEFERSQAEKKLQKAGEDTPVIRVAQQSYDPTDISMDVVFNVPMNREESASDEPAPSKDPEDMEVQKSHLTITMRKEVVERSDISLDDVFSSSTHQEKAVEEVEAPTTSTFTVTSSAPLTLDDLFGSKDCETEVKPDPAQPSTSAPDVTSSASINLDDVFSSGTSKAAPESNAETDEDKKIRQRIAEFQKAQQDKESRNGEEKQKEMSHRILEDSDIPMSDVFNFSSTKQTEDPHAESTIVVTTSEEETTKTDSRTRTETSTDTYSKRTEIPGDDVTTSINLDDIFSSGASGSSPKAETDEDKKIRQRIAEFQKAQQDKKSRSSEEKQKETAHRILKDSDIPMSDVFNFSGSKSEDPEDRPTIVVITSEEKKTKTDSRTRTETSTDTYTKRTGIPGDDITSATSINLDDVFSSGTSKAAPESETEEDKKIRQRIAEFQRAQQDKENRTDQETTQESRHRILEESDIPMSDVFNCSKPEDPEDRPTIVVTTSEEETTKTDSTTRTETSTDTYTKRTEIPGDDVTSSSAINLDDVFSSGASRPVPDSKAETDEDKKIRQRIAEFQKAQQDKESRVGQETTEESIHRILKESHIPMSDVFNFSSTKQTEDPHAEPTVVVRTSEEETTKTDSTTRTETSTDTYTKRAKIPGDEVTSSASINLDDVFSSRASESAIKAETDEDKKIHQRIAEFQKAQQDKESRTDQETTQESRHRILEDSDIPMSDVFNFSNQKPSPEATVFKTSEEETKTSTSTRTETSTDTYTKQTDPSESEVNLDDVFSYSNPSAPTLDDLFGPQTPTAIPTVAITSEDVPASESESRTPLTHKSLSNLLVPGKWNDSMMSTTSTISLDDSFNNSLAEPKMRKPLSLPVDNWIDDLVAKTTDEATREAPKTPKSGTYFPSPTRISQEIKYEWVADLVGVQEQSEDPKEDPEEHQTNEEHLQKQDSTWVSSVVYRPTLETSAYTLRASQNLELDMDKVFEECLKKKDDEECECTACRLTEQELEEMRNRKIEKQVVGAVEESSSESRKPLEIPNPSEFSIDEIFHPEVPLLIQTGPSHQVPSTSSPPLENTRTYYLSPKVSETVTTTHQWKDADISIDEIFSPVSSTNENRRFSNFYEDRSGWDTIGSEDSGVMSGGDRPRRRSSRTVDRVIDEAFKDIFENQNQPSTSEVKHRDDQPETETETQYDDFYITSLNEGDIEATDSEVDGENLDVTQFVDDILGKSLDEAAFLSSTKSLRDHTDTSIDRKKSGDRVHPYYRTRTDTSINKRSKPEVITEDHEGHDEIMKLVFVDRSLSTSTSKGSLSRASGSGVVKPNDEELLEIEITSDCFLIKGSYSLLIPKTDPLGQMLQKLRDQNDSLATLDFSLTRKLKKLLVNCIREKAMSPSDSPKYDGLSSRGQSLIESIDHASSTFLRMKVDKFEPTRNPQGIVNFCTAENNICTPLLEEKFKHLELFFPNTEHLVRYPPSGGWPEAREVLVKYFKEFMSARVTTEELVLTASTRTGYDVVSYCLFEQDDVLLTNGPVYTGTISNVQERALCKVECVPTDLSNPRLEVKKYEEELSRQTALDNTVSGIIIVNPHNPLGVVFPPEDVVNLCNWAASKNLHVIIDEVFANCVFDKSSSKFRPFLSYRHRVHRPENIAWLWSVSKDFGLPGLKFAVIHSANEGLRKAALKLQLYHPCSPFVQDFTVKLLSDSEWLREFHGEVTRRMAIHYRYTAENLKRLEIPFVTAQAGIFVFADFSKHLTSISQLGELDLFERLGSAGVMLTPGVHQKCHVFGWFRLVFACSKQELEEGFRRLFIQLGSHLQPVGSVLY